jgi:hypothetical protein
MIYYRCYDAHAEDRRWSETDYRWRVAFSRDKQKVKTTDKACYGLLMREGRADCLSFYIYSSLKPVRKEDMSKFCREALHEHIAGYETEEVT